MRNIWIITCTIVCFFAVEANTENLPKAKVTFQVVDEHGISIPHVSVSMGFAARYSSSPRKEYQTDAHGVCVIEEPCFAGMGGRFMKKGYYHSGGGYGFTLPQNYDTLPERWEPWNPTVTIVMKKKRNPVPMYQKYTDWMRMPEFDTPVGYDLEQGDWVAPHGEGKVADFVFTMHTTSEPKSATYTLSFSNPGDGILAYPFEPSGQSWFKWPFEAPLEGYESGLTRHKEYGLAGGLPTTDLQKDEDINYIFRVRSVVDNDGQIVSAKYGKIEGEVTHITKGGIKFSYWFNPDGTRNLEEDPKQNLFKHDS